MYGLRHKIRYEPQRFYSRARSASFDLPFFFFLSSLSFSRFRSARLVSSSRREDRKRHKCYPIGTYLAGLLFPLVLASIPLGAAPFTRSTFAAGNNAEALRPFWRPPIILSSHQPIGQCISHFFMRVGSLMTCGWRSGDRL